MGFDIKRASIPEIKKQLGKAFSKYKNDVNARTSSPGLSGFLDLSPTTTWRLKMIDPPYTSFVGQFRATNLIEQVGAKIQDIESLNKQDTEKVWVGGEPGTVSFITRVWATSSTKSVRTSIELLRSFTKRDDALKRAPLFVFTSGTDLRFNVFVKSVGGIQYDNPRVDGTIRGATFQITMLVIDRLPSQNTDTTLTNLIGTGLGVISGGAVSGWEWAKSFFVNIPGGSLHLKGKRIIVRDGQTFEHISKQEYGDARYGDILRRVYFNNPRNSIKNSLEVGDYIDIVDPSDIRSVAVTPQSVALKDVAVNTVNIRNHFELRSQERKIYPSA